MITLAANASGQKIYTTAYQGRMLLDESFSNYLVLFYQGAGSIEYAFIGNISTDNPRYTAFDIDTDTDNPTAVNIQIPDNINGIFYYIIYGQNSESNLDPMDSTVVGEVERGYVRIADPDETFNNDNTPEATFTTYAGS